jgi:hypothetical protein
MRAHIVAFLAIPAVAGLLAMPIHAEMSHKTLHPTQNMLAPDLGAASDESLEQEEQTQSDFKDVEPVPADVVEVSTETPKEQPQAIQ